MEPRFFEDAAALRRWLARHHEDAKELLVGFRKVATGARSVTYAEALDEALCVGWIDGVRRRIDDASYSIRFTPRRKGSNWSAVNVRRARELEKTGRMRPAGRAAFAARDASKAARYAYERRDVDLDAESAAALRKHAKAWAFWNAQPPYYRKTAAWYVTSAKKEGTRARRRAALVACSRKGERLPQFEARKAKG